MNEEQHLRLLAIDAAGRSLPLAFCLPHREAVRKPRGHLIAEEDLPFQLADRTLGPRQSEVERGADLRQERRKYRLRAGGGDWLLKFVGLGDAGEDAYRRAQMLGDAGFSPRPAGLRHG